MRLFDSHCHLDFVDFDADRAEVLARARAAGVRDLLIPGYSPSRWGVASGLVAQGHAAGVRVHVAVGLHPFALAEDAAGAWGYGSAPAAASARENASAQPAATEDGDLCAQIVAAASQYGAVAIGECGLDAPLARRDAERASLARQRVVLREHLRAAERTGLPLVLHVVRAHPPVLELLRSGPGESHERGGVTRGRPRGVVHAFSGSVELAREYVRLGFMLAFGGAITRDSHARARQVARDLADEHLLLESDAPSGRLLGGPPRNEPGAVSVVVEALARLRGQPAEHVAAITRRNAVRLFGLDERVPGHRAR